MFQVPRKTWTRNSEPNSRLTHGVRDPDRYLSSHASYSSPTPSSTPLTHDERFPNAARNFFTFAIPLVLVVAYLVYHAIPHVRAMDRKREQREREIARGPEVLHDILEEIRLIRVAIEKNNKQAG